jgi:DegV family protein with EDD domain
MNKIRILADSACDLEIKHYEKYGIELVPLNVYLDGKQCRDILDIQSKEIYRLMRDEDKMMSTSQATPIDFKNVFTKVFDEGYESIIYIAFSSGLSGTCQSAIIAKEDFEDKDITIIDTKCASLGYGLVVLKAAKMLLDGKSKEEIIKETQRKITNTEHIFIVDDLKYLQKGGRISFAKFVLGTMLNIKPIMHVEDGKLFPYAKAKGKNKVLQEMVKALKERITGKNELIGICHADDIETAMELEKMIRSEVEVGEIIYTYMGATVGSHTGPGCIALFFEGKHEYINIK